MTSHWVTLTARGFAPSGLGRSKSNIANHSVMIPVGPCNQYLNWLECGVYKVQSCSRTAWTLKMHSLLRVLLGVD